MNDYLRGLLFEYENMMTDAARNIYTDAIVDLYEHITCGSGNIVRLEFNESALVPSKTVQRERMATWTADNAKLWHIIKPLWDDFEEGPPGTFVFPTRTIKVTIETNDPQFTESDLDDLSNVIGRNGFERGVTEIQGVNGQRTFTTYFTKETR